MRRPLILAAAGAALLTLSAAVGGADPLARVLLQAGLPGTAAQIARDPGLKGAALYRSGRYAEAAAIFRDAGDGYNQGLAAARTGDYATALVALERHLARHPGDAEARTNHRLITALLSGVVFEGVDRPDDRDRAGPEVEAEPGQGGARAASTGDEANDAKAGFWMPEVTGEGLRRVRKAFDAQYLTANQRWLNTMEDQPGVYLRARLAAQQKAREAAGVALPLTEDGQ